MFTLYHFVYLFVALAVVITVSVLLRNVKPKTRISILRYTSLIMVLIHISPLIVEFFIRQNYLDVGLDSAIWPIYFCNVVMWLFAITFCSANVMKKLYPVVINFAFIGGLLTIALPQFHSFDADFFDWIILRSYLTHTLMLFGALFAFMSKEYKPKVKDIIWVAISFIPLILWGLLTNYLFSTYKGYTHNSMYLEGPIFEGTILYWYVAITLIVVVLFSFFSIYEHFTLKKEDRSLYKLLNKKK